MSFYKRQPDIIIKNGTIVDGTGDLPYFADIAIIGDKIDYIGDLRGVSAPLVIDAHHKYVTPGFIDPHTHSDQSIWANPRAESAVRQGVTTEVVGNCGYSLRHVLSGIPFDPAGDGPAREHGGGAGENGRDGRVHQHRVAVRAQLAAPPCGAVHHRLYARAV